MVAYVFTEDRQTGQPEPNLPHNDHQLIRPGAYYSKALALVGRKLRGRAQTEVTSEWSVVNVAGAVAAGDECIASE